MTAGRGKPVPDYGKSPQADALRAQLAALARLEATPVYQEMCAAADSSRAAEAAAPRWANGQLAGMTPAQRAAHETGKTHGRIATYQDGCRCDDCRRVSAEVRARHRGKKVAS